MALKQAQARGFFTYADLAAATASGRGGLLGAVARGAGAGWLCAAAAYAASLAALLALVASSLLLARAAAALRAAPHAPAAPAAYPANIITHDAMLAGNLTDRLPEGVVLDEAEATEKLRCCTRWYRYREAEPARPTWSESVVVYDWRSLEPWWSTTSVLNWLYQSSLINPMQRWLEKVNEYGAALRRELGGPGAPRCEAWPGRAGAPPCVRQWLNLSKLGALAASVSDR